MALQHEVPSLQLDPGAHHFDHMTNRHKTTDEREETDWIAAWIAQQRELLARAGQAGLYEGQATELGRRSAEAGQAFFDNLRQLVGAAAKGEPNADPFNVGEALLSAWTGATMLQAMIAEQAAELLRRLPPVGLAREHTEAWRELATAHAEYKRIEHELRAVLGKVQLEALDLLEKRVRERRADAAIGSFRELYDLWVECGEQVYGELAHGAAYSKLQAELTNATMRLRARVQGVLERALKQLDLPTRSELNSLHRQVRELRMELEALRQTRVRPGARKAQPKTKRKAKARTR